MKKEYRIFFSENGSKIIKNIILKGDSKKELRRHIIKNHPSYRVKKIMVV